jgi:oligogalacturonide lyase
LSRRCGRSWSRRGFLAAVSLPLPAAVRRGSVTPSETIRYVDPATEFYVERLTDPSYTSVLPNADSHFISRRRNFLLYASDRSGSLQAWRLNLKNGQSRLLTDTPALSVRSLTLLPDDGDFLYFDSGHLYQAGLNGGAGKGVYEVKPGFGSNGCVRVSSDGESACFTESNGSVWRIQLVELKTGKVRTVLRSKVEVGEALPRPGRRSILYRRSGELWTAEYSGRKARKVPSPPGTVGPALWREDGSSLLYLHFPAEKGQLNTIREYYADSRQDRAVAKTTQFVSFGANANSSVFIGASGGRATPHVILMLRAGGRELTICEHRASDPAKVTPVFSPNSRRIFFASDRHGKSAIYSMIVDDLVEATEREA